MKMEYRKWRKREEKRYNVVFFIFCYFFFSYRRKGVYKQQNAKVILGMHARNAINRRVPMQWKNSEAGLSRQNRGAPFFLSLRVASRQMRLNRSRAILPGKIATQEGIFRTRHMQRYAKCNLTFRRKMVRWSDDFKVAT